jgi:dolichol-phosphate mannosyltransferase
MKLSVVIPAHNEEGHIKNAVESIKNVLVRESIEYEIVVVNDNSTDKTVEIVSNLEKQDSGIRLITNKGRNGFGFAVKKGLEKFTGDAVVITMADSSDDPEDIVKFYRKLEQGYDCVFGTRFVKEAKLVDYPLFKLLLNRAGNIFIKLLFGLKYNDVTNAFKCYRREVIKGVSPILSHHFNLTIELPLKAIVRGYSYTVIPTNWYNREEGVSKWKIKEMGSRYLFVVLYALIEKYLSRGDYKKDN